MRAPFIFYMRLIQIPGITRTTSATAAFHPPQPPNKLPMGLQPWRWGWLPGNGTELISRRGGHFLQLAESPWKRVISSIIMPLTLLRVTVAARHPRAQPVRRVREVGLLPHLISKHQRPPSGASVAGIAEPDQARPRLHLPTAAALVNSDRRCFRTLKTVLTSPSALSASTWSILQFFEVRVFSPDWHDATDGFQPAALSTSLLIGVIWRYLEKLHVTVLCRSLGVTSSARTG